MCGNSCCKLTVACESFCAATLWIYKQSCSFSEPLWGQRHHFRSLFGCRNRISKFWFAEIRLLPINVLLTERWGWKKGCGSHSQGLFVLACDTLLDGRIIQRWGKKKKYLNKWHICWGEVQPLWSRLHYGDQRCSWPACALTLFLEAEALTLEVNTDGRRRSGYKTAALLRKQLGCCSQLQRSFFPQLSATCIHSLVHLGLTRSGASGNLWGRSLLTIPSCFLSLSLSSLCRPL